MYNLLKGLASGSKDFYTKPLFFLFCLLYFILSYTYLLGYPLGLHFIRQTDSISFIFYYLHKDNFNFFDLGNLSLYFENGKASCEFPIIYYFIFIIFKIFGIHLVVVRWFSLITSLISIFFLLVISNSLLKNRFLSLFTVLFVISSTVYRYYSINFLPDSFAISLTFIGFYYFFRFNEYQKKPSKICLFIFFTLAALIKIYYGIYLLAATLFLLLKFKRKSIETIALVLLSFCTILAWYAYSTYYNYFHHSDYYLTHALPIWKMSIAEIKFITNAILEYWYNKYYLPTIFHTLIVLSIVFLLPIGNKDSIRYYKPLLFFCTCGSLIYILLFFKQFRDHDYYFLPVIPCLFFVAVFALKKVLSFSDHKIYKITIVFLMGLISCIGFNYSSLNLNRRYNNSIDDFSIVAYQLINVSGFIQQNNIDDDKKFLVVGDRTKNGSLVFLNKFGWTYSDFNSDPGSIKSNLPLADYLLILKPSANRIPDDIKKRIVNCKKISYNSNDFYSLKELVK